MGADKIFVLILSLAFAAFVGYLMWHSRKGQANVNPAAPAEPPAGDPKPDEPTAGEAPAAGRKARNRARRK